MSGEHGHRLEHARSRVAELDRSVLAMSTQRNFAEHRRIGRLAENSLH